MSRPSDRAFTRSRCPIGRESCRAWPGPGRRTKDRAQPGGRVRAVAQRHGDRVAEVDAAQLGGHVDAEFGGQREDVAVVGEDLPGRGLRVRQVVHSHMLASHGQHGPGESAGQAVRLQHDDGPPGPVGAGMASSGLGAGTAAVTGRPRKVP